MVATIVWSSHTTHDRICLFSCFGFGSLQEVIDDTWREMFSNIYRCHAQRQHFSLKKQQSGHFMHCSSKVMSATYSYF